MALNGNITAPLKAIRLTPDFLCDFLDQFQLCPIALGKQRRNKSG